MLMTAPRTTTLAAQDGAGVARACKAIRDAGRRDGVLEALLRGAARQLERPQLYRVRGGHLQGLLELRDGRVTRATMAHRVFGLRLAEGARHAVLRRELGVEPLRGSSGEQLCRLWVPISVGGRVICLLTGVAREQGGASAARQLLRLAEETALALCALVVATRCVAGLQRRPHTDRAEPTSTSPGQPVRLLTRRKRPHRAGPRRRAEPQLALLPRPRPGRIVAALPVVPVREDARPDRSSELPPRAQRRRSAHRHDVVVDSHSVHRLYGGLEGSVRGVFVATDQPLPLGAEVQLTLRLAALAPDEILCEVAWLRVCSGAGGHAPRGMGLRFAHAPSQPLRGAIERFAERHGTLLYA